MENNDLLKAIAELERHDNDGYIGDTKISGNCTGWSIKIVLDFLRSLEDKEVIPSDEYEQLQYDSEFLGMLQACGVDNWGGYDDAVEMMEEECED